MKIKNISFLCAALVVTTITFPTYTADQNFFKKGSTESKAWNGVKIATGTLALVGTYRQNFFFGLTTAVASAACIMSGIYGLEEDINESLSFTEKTISKINKTINPENVENALGRAKIRIKNAFNALFR